MFTGSPAYEVVKADALRHDPRGGLLPYHTMSEEEAVSMIRADPHPTHSVLPPAERYPAPSVSRAHRGDTRALLCMNLAGVLGYNIKNTSLYYVVHWLCTNKIASVFTEKKIHMYTFDDDFCEIYTYLYHLLSDWSPAKIKGHPLWRVDDDDFELYLNEGPPCIAQDPCRIGYNKMEYQGNISSRNAYNQKSSQVFSIFTRGIRQRHRFIISKLPPGSIILYPRKRYDTRSQLGSFINYRSWIRSKDEEVWSVTLAGGSKSFAEAVHGAPDWSGFSSTHGAAEHAHVILLAMGGCYSVEHWVRSRLSLDQFTPDEVIRNIKVNLTDLHHALSTRQHVTSQSARMSALQPLWDKMWYWVWVLSCCNRGSAALYETI